MSDHAVEFWCFLPVELSEVFRRFAKAFPASEVVHDAENVWEWFEGRTDDRRIGFNITRQWDEDVIPDELVRMSILLLDKTLSVDHVGELLARALEVEVHTGTVTYLKGDDFDFKIRKSYTN